MFKVEVLHMDGKWKSAGRLQQWTGEEWIDATFETQSAADAAVAEKYADVLAEATHCIRVVPTDVL